MSDLPRLGLLYLDHVLQFFAPSNFKGWPNKIEIVTYHWGNDKERFINEVRRKKIDVLVGNVPATAYETFRDIARELPEVRFVPSLDTQFPNKSKENVTRLCEKYDIPIPPTHIFYDKTEAYRFLDQTTFPKIIKKSYGPSNYGGYFVHKVDTAAEAKALFDAKGYCPFYLQDFVPMAADIRVMLIGHRPVCAFWRRPADGGWLTNTSQGGNMDYADVPEAVLDLSVRVSKATKAEYFACDVAVGKDGSLSILECATAFAAFPYIRDWIGQYLVWLLSGGKFRKPWIPLYNWEELGKMDSRVLRRMRHIHFDQEPGLYASETGEMYQDFDEEQGYPLEMVAPRDGEEWPSEQWRHRSSKMDESSISEDDRLVSQAVSRTLP